MCGGVAAASLVEVFDAGIDNLIESIVAGFLPVANISVFVLE